MQVRSVNLLGWLMIGFGGSALFLGLAVILMGNYAIPKAKKERVAAAESSTVTDGAKAKKKPVDSTRDLGQTLTFTGILFLGAGIAYRIWLQDWFESHYGDYLDALDDVRGVG